MRWTAALALALAVHAAVVAMVWLSARLLPAARAAIDPAVAVELMVDEVERRTANSAAPINRRAIPRSSRIAAQVHPHALPRALSLVEPPRPGPPPAPIAPAAEAPPPGVDLRLRQNPIAPIAAQSPPPPADARPGQVIETPTVRGTVQADGALKVRDKPSVQLGSDLTSPGALVKKWLDDPRKQAAERDGTVQLFRGTFDVTDSIMRAFGQDPYRAEKMKMLDATRERRLALAARADAERQRQALAGLPAMLREIWGDTARPIGERRKLVFELWDECQEAPEGDVEGTSPGARARRAIILFIRTAARPGTPEAYSKDELLALNRARQSRQRFAPYF